MKKMWGWFQFVLIVTIVTAGILSAFYEASVSEAIKVGLFVGLCSPVVLVLFLFTVGLLIGFLNILWDWEEKNG